MLGILVPGLLSAQGTISPAASDSGVARLVEGMVRHELAAKSLPGLSIALVAGRNVVWARGFGVVGLEDSTPAGAETVYRVGALSQSITAAAALQQVEAGRLRLDQPVTRFLPRFEPRNPFPSQISVRQLLAHYAGLPRNPPVGGVGDPAQVSLDSVVGSLNGSVLIAEPGRRFAYSVSGPAAVGLIVERLAGISFPAYTERQIFQCAGMTHSSFSLPDGAGERVAPGGTRTADGREITPPAFDYGVMPSENLYSTVLDLARFVRTAFEAGNSSGCRLLAGQSVFEMWRAQYTRPTVTSSAGLGFMVRELDGHQGVSQSGDAYGTSATMVLLPSDRLAAIVVVPRGGAGAVARRVAEAALRAMLAAREGRPLPEPVLTAPVPDSLRTRLAGDYAGAGQQVRLRIRHGRLLYAPAGHQPLELRLLGGRLVVDDARVWGPTLIPLENGGIRIGTDTLARTSLPRPDAAPDRWRDLLGEYGWDYYTLYLLEDAGRLHLLADWFTEVPLTEQAGGSFRCPDEGWCAGEQIVIRRDSARRVSGLVIGGTVYPRRHLGPEDGNQLKITPVRPVPDLLREARNATPPVQAGDLLPPDLVDLATLDSTIRFDIRYATTNNFLGSVFYSQARAFLQRPAAAALLRVQRRLAPLGYGLLIHDAYRPWYVTRVFWDATPDSLHWLVANPANGSRHNRGAAVDLTLYDLATGRPLDMVGTYDEATPRSMPDYPGGTARQRWDRELLRQMMESEGFAVYSEEWWHFDYQDWRRYPVLNLPFEELAGRR
ncbi:MAG: serine hydrolase [Gemmatimonadales bacterium]